MVVILESRGSDDLLGQVLKLHVRSRRLFSSLCRSVGSHARRGAESVLRFLRRGDMIECSARTCVDGRVWGFTLAFGSGRSMCVCRARSYGIPLPALKRFDSCVQFRTNCYKHNVHNFLLISPGI